MKTALEIIARLGSDNPPTREELTSARNTIARELHALKGKPNLDLEAITSLRETYTLVSTAVKEATKAEEKALSEVENILDGVEDPDAGEEDESDNELSEDADEAEEVEEDDAPASVLSIQEALARLNITDRPAAPADELSNRSENKTSVMIGSDIKDDATWQDMIDAFASPRSSIKTGKERIVRVSTEYDSEQKLPGKIADNTKLVDSFVTPEAVTAAGGCCSLPTPIYDNPVQGSTARPIRDSLGAFGADRGKVVLYPAICIPQAGSGVWTCEQDAAVTDDPETWKDCTEIECDEEVEAEVEAIYQCLTVGRWQQKFAPEQWAGRLQAVAISHARMAEVNLFDKMRENVTSTHTGLATGSTYLNLVNTVARATALMRQDQRLADIQFQLWIGDWIKAAIGEGFGINRLDKGGDLDDVQQRVAAALANEGVTVTYSLDIDDLEDFQYDGALADYPATASAVLAPSGYFTFLDGGQFDLGTEITDHDLNRQNKIAAFAESYEGLLARGCNAKALDIPVECDLTLACPA